MLPRILTSLLIGLAVIGVLAYLFPQYLNFVWIGLSALFVVGLGVMVYIYSKRVFTLMKEMKKQ
ncbi:hypothetical protein [Alkalibacillus salilacus]|uniref:Membrane protein YccC n=1 Tax=Alkalibacillus salilacus TaxID=284582 RepID=A0ABT9VGI8_9BACI|nr:hypothetical protein [Alkalibacillus salilacus]MDQ0160024.1 putative membrane protein YccC [Alkalibacillus salilacus]